MGISIHIRGSRPHNRNRRSSRRSSGSSGKPVGASGQILFGFVSILLASAIIFVAYLEDRRSQNYISITGVVDDYSVDYDRDSGEKYSEIAEYEVNGVKYRCTSNTSSSFPKSIGSEIEVRYDKNSPSVCLVGSKSQSTVVYVCGGLFIVVGICLILSGVKRKLSIK